MVTKISTKISERTNGLWTPSTGGIYPLIKKIRERRISSRKMG